MTESRPNRQRFGRKSTLAFALATLAITASILFACTRETTTVQTVIVEREITVEPDVVVQTVVFEREITVKPEIEVQTVVIEREVTSEPNIVVVEREVPTTPQIVVQTVLVERVVTAEPTVIVVEREVTVVQTVVVERVVTAEPEIVVVEREVTVEPETVIQTVIVGPKPLPSPAPTPEIEFNSPLAVCQPIPVLDRSTSARAEASAGVPAGFPQTDGASGARGSASQPFFPPWSPPSRPPLTTFEDSDRNEWALTSDDEMSTFSLDTDRTSFQLAVQWVREGYEVVPDSVRAEEWINAFAYLYQEPEDISEFAIHADILPHPLDPSLRLARIAFQAPEVYSDLPLNVTLVLDASGSMADGNRVEIAREAAETLRHSLDPDDRISIVHFTDDVIHELTVVDASPSDPESIVSIAKLGPHAATNVQAGLNLGVQLANSMRIRRPQALNYVILMSDGVANVDATNPFAILDTAVDVDPSNPLRLITIGVGVNNYNDVLLEQLAQNGNGWYRYLNEPSEGRRLFRRESWVPLSVPFADQTRAQVRWNLHFVKRWRMIGYENRVTSDDSFATAQKNFAEIPSSTATTVFFEFEPKSPPTQDPQFSTLGNVELRWVSPDSGDDVYQIAGIKPRQSEHDDFSMFGAIVALASDRYSDVCDTQSDAVYLQLTSLIDLLKDIGRPIADTDAFQDFHFVLNKLAQSTKPSLPSGYGR